MESIRKLEEVEFKFKKWRSKRKGRKKIPDQLLNEIIKLPSDISVNKIHKTLSLDWNKVKKLRNRSASQEGSCLAGPFIEILPQISNSSKEIIFENPDGSKMAVHADSHSEVEGLLRLFLESSK